MATGARTLFSRLKSRLRGRTEENFLQVASLRERLGAKERQISELKRELVQKGSTEAFRGVKPENIVWIFGAGRTGSTWLSRMMGEMEGHAVWGEPLVGALFDPYHLRLEDRKGKHFILSPRYRKTWLKSIRAFVLDGANVRFSEAGGGVARFPQVSGPRGYLVIKEPGGSAGAPLLIEALPESRMVLLIRDPRDVAASWVDARKEDTWLTARKKTVVSAEDVVRDAAKSYLRQVGEARRAYDAHGGRKVLVRYEGLRADALGTMRRIYSELGIAVDENDLRRAVDEHAWENIPEEEKGEGKIFRKASPGGWREDLTPEQAAMVERITAPLIEEFYPA